MVCHGALALCLLNTAAGQGASAQEAAGQDVTAARVQHEAREALGGEAALLAIRGVRATGQASRTLGPMRIAGEVELHLALPDRYVRVDRLRLAGTVSNVAMGFNATALVQRLDGPGGVAIDPGAGLAPEAKEAAARVAAEGVRQDLARWLLGLFCGSAGVYPTQISSGGVAESPDGRADVLDITGPEGFAVRLFIHAETRLPLMASWMAPDVLGAVRALSRPGQADPTATAEQLIERTVEHRLYFADYRRVGAVRWPFRVRRSVDGEVVEDLTFDRFDINPAFDARVFEPRP
jgi:hypothetical protein